MLEYISIPDGTAENNAEKLDFSLSHERFFEKKFFWQKKNDDIVSPIAMYIVE